MFLNIWFFYNKILFFKRFISLRTQKAHLHWKEVPRIL